MRRSALFLALAMLPWLAVGDAIAQADACRERVEHRLGAFKLSMNDVNNPQWQVDRFHKKGGAQGMVSGYRFYGQPKSCSQGQLVMEISPNCGVYNVYTRGGCRIEGVGSSWF